MEHGWWVEEIFFLCFLGGRGEGVWGVFGWIDIWMDGMGREGRAEERGRRELLEEGLVRVWSDILAWINGIGVEVRTGRVGLTNAGACLPREGATKEQTSTAARCGDPLRIPRPSSFQRRFKHPIWNAITVVLNCKLRACVHGSRALWTAQA